MKHAAMQLVLLLLGVLLAVSAFTSEASADTAAAPEPKEQAIQRVALVIGNGAYPAHLWKIR